MERRERRQINMGEVEAMRAVNWAKRIDKMGGITSTLKLTDARDKEYARLLMALKHVNNEAIEHRYLNDQGNFILAGRILEARIDEARTHYKIEESRRVTDIERAIASVIDQTRRMKEEKGKVIYALNFGAYYTQAAAVWLEDNGGAIAAAAA